MASKVTVFPVPVTPKVSPEEPDPARLDAEIQRLRAENAVLRVRLAAVEAIALEREGTIEDLRHALQVLPSAWAEKLDRKVVAAPEIAEPPAPPFPAPTSDTVVDSDQAEAFFAEIAALRVRLERKQLEAEQEILEQERQRLLADIEWTRRWQRSRGFRPTDG